MFESSRPSVLLEYFRVPYEVRPPRPEEVSRRALEFIRADDADRSISFPAAEWVEGNGRPRSQLYQLDSILIFGHVVPDDVVAGWLDEAGGGWERLEPVRDRRGEVHSWIWRDAQGSVFLPFDPDAVIEAYWRETYRTDSVTSFKRLALAADYRQRPALPRPTQIWLRRHYSGIQARTTFPRWPLETALHDLYAFLFRLLSEVAGRPVPRIAAWPKGRTWALVLTHDVETDVGYQHLDLLRDLELALGYRSAWNFVPRRYDVDDETVRDLSNAGFEVGVHGLYHDGRDLESRPVFEQRLPLMRRFAERWHAVGFRAPATRRVWELIADLGFDYDSSYPDTDPFEPDAGGCCTWLPYFIGDVIELPITLTQDHTLFTILRADDEQVWLEKTRELRKRGGMALLITHPDYMLDVRALDAYRRFLGTFVDDENVWHALPREVSAWWRRRGASRLELVRDRWEIVGPAAGEGTVELVGAA
jgi:hypothetical protein